MAAGTLYVVATPLGHLGDLSSRAIDTLRQVGVVAAEDTRRTQGLLHSIAASPRLLSWHAHSGPRRTATLVEILAGGTDVALVTDAGTPAISDPGVELVAEARAAGIRVVPIPGPSAVTAALSASGLAGDRYLFLGFVPRKGSERRRLLARAVSEPWSVVFFEAPGRLTDLLEDLAALAGGERPAVVARELTKVYEELRGGSLADLKVHYETTPPRGEVTLILAPGVGGEDERAAVDPEAVAAAIREGLAAGESRKDLVRTVMQRFALPRNEAYRLVMGDP